MAQQLKLTAPCKPEATERMDFATSKDVHFQSRFLVPDASHVEPAGWVIAPYNNYPSSDATKGIKGLSQLLLSISCGFCYWVAVKELKLSYYIGEALLFTIYTHYGNLISVP